MKQRQTNIHDRQCRGLNAFDVNQTWGHHRFPPQLYSLVNQAPLLLPQRFSFLPFQMCKCLLVSSTGADSLRFHVLLHNSKVLHCRFGQEFNLFSRLSLLLYSLIIHSVPWHWHAQSQERCLLSKRQLQKQGQAKQWSMNHTWLFKPHKYVSLLHCKAFLLQIQWTGVMFSHQYLISLTG